MMARGIFGTLFGATAAAPAHERHSLAELERLHAVLLHNTVVNEGNRAEVVETLRACAELLIWGDQNDARVFEYFLEHNLLQHFKRILEQPQHRKGEVAVQLLQTLSILITNIRKDTSLYYLFSNNHINEIAQLVFDFSDEEALAHYITFMKAISFKLNPSTIQFFFQRSTNGKATFPLYTEAVKLFSHPEGMVRAGVRMLSINIYSVQDDAMQTYIATSPSDVYFQDIAVHLTDRAIALDRQLASLQRGHASALYHVNAHIAEVEDTIAYVSDILDVAQPALAHAVTAALWDHFLLPTALRPLLRLLGSGHEGDAVPSVRPVTAFFILERLLNLLRCPTLVDLTACALFATGPVPRAHFTRPALGPDAVHLLPASVPNPYETSVAHLASAPSTPPISGGNTPTAAKAALLGGLLGDARTDGRTDRQGASTSGAGTKQLLNGAQGSGAQGSAAQGSFGAQGSGAQGGKGLAQGAAAQKGGKASQEANSKGSGGRGAHAAASQSDSNTTAAAQRSDKRDGAKAGTGAAGAVRDPTNPAPGSTNAPTNASTTTPTYAAGLTFESLQGQVLEGPLGSARCRGAVIACLRSSDPEHVGAAMRALLALFKANLSDSVRAALGLVRGGGRTAAADVSSFSITLESSVDRAMRASGSLEAQESASALAGTSLESAAATSLSRQRSAFGSPGVGGSSLKSLNSERSLLSDVNIDDLVSDVVAASLNRAESNVGRSGAASSDRSDTNKIWSSGSGGAVAKADELGDALVGALCNDRATGAAACGAGWLLQQLLPRAASGGGSALPPPTAARLARAHAAASAALSEQLLAQWSDALAMLVHSEWPTLRPVTLKGDAPATATTLLSWLIAADCASSAARPLAASAVAAVAALRACQRAVALSQVNSLLTVASVPADPPCLPPNPATPEVREGDPVSAALSPRLPCRVSFKRGEERTVFLALLPSRDGRSSPQVVLTEAATPTFPTVKVSSAAPLMPTAPRSHERHAQWLHCAVRPSVAMLKSMLAAAKKQGLPFALSRAVQQLVDGMWVLSFAKPAIAATAIAEMEAAIATSRAEFADLLAPLT